MDYKKAKQLNNRIHALRWMREPYCKVEIEGRRNEFVRLLKWELKSGLRLDVQTFRGETGGATPNRRQRKAKAEGVSMYRDGQHWFLYA